MYSKQMLYRVVVVSILFVPLFYYSVGAKDFIEVFEFILAMVGIRTIAFFFFPDNKEK